MFPKFYLILFFDVSLNQLLRISIIYQPFLENLKFWDYKVLISFNFWFSPETVHVYSVIWEKSLNLSLKTDSGSCT